MISAGAEAMEFCCCMCFGNKKKGKASEIVFAYYTRPWEVLDTDPKCAEASDRFGINQDFSYGDTCTATLTVTMLLTCHGQHVV